MTVATDRPITRAEEDRFGRYEFAARIAKVISSLKDSSSIVISVNAPWGEGKTSVLNMIEEGLSHTGNTLVLRFNPWRFPDEERLLLNFFNTLAERLKFDLKEVSEKIGEGFRDFVSCLSNIQIAGFGIGSGPKEVLDKRLPNPDVEEIKRRISDALLNSPKKIVIFMDDIDRLNNREIQAVFRLVKLTADFPNTAYVLAFDDEKVSASLAEQFGSQEAGHSFLEKIVQVPLPVPPAAPQILRKMVFEGVESALTLAEVELAQEEIERLVMVFDKSFNRMLSSPRAVKRFTNMLSFVLPILKGEANSLDLIFIEAVRAFFPKLYEAIRSEPDLFLRDSLAFHLPNTNNRQEEKKHFDEVMAKPMSGLSRQDKEGALFILQVLFPKIREYGITTADYYVKTGYEDFEAKKRIATSRYFRRYFNYGVPPNDISDRELALFIDNIAGTEVEQIMERLESLSSGNRAEVLIWKLRMQEDEISSERARKLALALSRRSDLIPEGHRDDNVINIGLLAQTAILLRQLIGRIDDTDERENTAKEVARNIERLPLAYEFSRKIKKLKKEPYSEEFVAVVSDQCEHEISQIFAAKLASSAESVPLEDSHPQYRREFYIAWRWGAQESLQQYAQRRLQKRPEDVGRFLNAVMGLGNTEESDFFPIMYPDDEYRFLADIIHPDEMMSFIRQCYPESNNTNLPRAVGWFVQRYEQAIATSAVE